MTQPTVLVIEDNALNRKLVRVLLSQEPFSLLFAETAEEGLELAREISPDLILMDVRLPGIDGLEATRRIRSDEQLRDTTVVAFTAHAMRGDREKAFSAGCDGYITKPIDTRNFAEQVHRFLASPAQGKGVKYQ
jgi:CheY-like chemotaxis protein